MKNSLLSRATEIAVMKHNIPEYALPKLRNIERLII